MNRLYIYTLLTFSFFACGRANHDVELLQQAEKYRNNPDSISAFLYKIENPDQLSEEYLADYDRLYAITQIYSGHPVSDEELFTHPLLYYQKTNNIDKLIQVYKIAGIYWLEFGDYERSFQYLNKGLELAQTINDYTNIIHFYRLITEEQKLQKDYDPAIHTLKKLVRISKTDESELYFDLAFCFAHLGQLDSVRTYMDKCIEIGVRKQDDGVAHYLRNYADILYENRKYKESILQLRKSLDYSEEYVLPRVYSSLSLSYLAISRIDSAVYYLDKAKTSLKTYSQSGNPHFITYRNNIMALEAIIAFEQAKHVSFFQMGNFNDSIVKEYQTKQEIIRTQLNERNRLETDNLQLKIDRQRIHFLITILLIAFFVLLFGIISYNRKRAKRIVEIEEKSETLQLLLDKALKEQSKEGIDDNFFKKILLQQLGIIRLIATNPSSQNQELLHQITRISSEDVNVESLLVWEDLYPIIDSIYNRFYTKTKNKYGDLLIDKELQLCCLLCAEFSTKEISVVTQQSVRTIYQRKTNIRQKLSMNEKGDIVEFLKEI